jgi:hypothetical protein
MFLMNKISELYLYNMMPFVAIWVGVGLGEQLRRAESRPLAFRALAVGLAVVFTSHAWAIQTKAAGMRQSGDRALSLLAQVPGFVDRVPPDGQLFLLNPATSEQDYSVFRLSGFNPLNKGTHRLNELTDRDDFRTRIVEHGQLGRIGARGDCLILSIENDEVRIFEESDRVCGGGPAGLERR